MMAVSALSQYSRSSKNQVRSRAAVLFSQGYVELSLPDRISSTVSLQYRL